MKFDFLVLGVIALALRLLEPIPDQLVMQNSYFSLDVAPYFSEPLIDCTVESPNFLSSVSDKLEKKELFKLPYSGPGQWAFVAATENSETVWVLMRELGVLVFALDSPPDRRLLQHYFEERICGRYDSLVLNEQIAVLHNSSDMLLLDISAKKFPTLLTTAHFHTQILAVFPLESSQLIVLEKDAGLKIYEFNEETGLAFNRSLDSAFGEHSSFLAIARTKQKLFALTEDGQLASVRLPDFSRLHKYAVRGQRLLATNNSVFVDSKTEVDILTDAVHSVSLPENAELLASAESLLFYRNGTHLSAVDSRVGLTYSEELGDLLSLEVVNQSSVLELRPRSAVLASFSASRTTIHGSVPAASSAVEVRFAVKSRSAALEGKFLLLVESPPLRILLLVVAGFGVVVGTLCACYLLYCIIVKGRREPVEEISILTEESTSGVQMNRDLGPMPHLDL